MSAATSGAGTIRRWRDRLAWLGGGDRRLLQQVPQARDRFLQMGVVLLTTASLAVVSMAFALHDGMHASWLVAVPAGLFWGFVILNLDRLLVLTMGPTRDLRHLLLLAAPRLLMAALLALVISTPLVLRIFSSTIDNEMKRYQLQQSREQAQQESGTADQTRADRIREQIDEQQRILDGHLPDEVVDPAAQNAESKVADLQARTDRARRAKDDAYEAWQCELYGAGARCHGASKRRGPGPLAGAKRQQYDVAFGAFTTLQRQLTAAQAVLVRAQGTLEGTQRSRLAEAQRAAGEQLPELEEQYERLEREIAADSAATDRANKDDTGILAQMRALSQATHEDSTLRTAHLVVAGLLFMIELLPVLVKILMNLAPASAYEVLAALEDEEVKDRVKIQRIEARQIEEDKSATRIDAERDMRERELKLSKQANERVADEMSTIVEAALADWSVQVSNGLGRQPDDGPNGNRPHANGTGPRPPRRPGRSSAWPPQPGSASPAAGDAAAGTTEIDPGYDLPVGGEL